YSAQKAPCFHRSLLQPVVTASFGGSITSFFPDPPPPRPRSTREPLLPPVRRPIRIQFQCSMCSVENIFMRSQPLPSECVGQHFEGGFGNHLLGSSSTQRRSHRSFQSAEEAFDRPASTKSGALQGFGLHFRAPFS